MLLDLLMLAIFSFFITCILFTYYHHAKQQEHFEENANQKPIWYNVASFLWSATSWLLSCIDQLLMNCLSYYLFHNLHGDLFIDNIEKRLGDTCVGNGNASIDELTKLEISELSNIICELYIDFWYRNISLEDSGGDEENFKFQCKKGLDEAFLNFYKLCSKQIDTKNLALLLVKQVEAHLTAQNGDNVKLGTKEEISLLLNLIDNVFVRVLPADVNPIMTNCDCCKGGFRKNCLQDSSNPVRLFIYNLIIYSLLLPLINRISNPFYFFYNFIYIVSHLGGISLDQFLSQFDEDDFFEERQAEVSQPVQVNFDSEDNENEKALFYEAIEESRNELLIFTNIGISDVKISTNDLVSSMSKINPYIDYIILFNVLESDRELENQKGNQMRFTGNGQTFLQRTYQVKRRFREFLSFQQMLEKNPEFRQIISKIVNKPSNIQFHSTSFLNYIKSTKINENSPLVKLRRDCLESFLIQLSQHKLINESREFCEFLGYKYKSMLEVKQLLKATAINLQDLQSDSKGNSLTKNFELNFKNIKDIFKIFLPVQAKLGQVSTQIEDVVVNDQICSKYSITKIETECNEQQNHMVLKLKLDKWADLSAAEEAGKENTKRPPKSSIEDSQLDHQVLSCLFVLFFRKYITFKAYVVERCASFSQGLFSKLRSMFTFNRMFRFYLHYLHVYLDGMDNDVSLEVYLISYQRFYSLFQEKDLKELFKLYVRQSEEKLQSECASSIDGSSTLTLLNGKVRLYLHKSVSYLCDHLNLFDTLFASFDTQHSNKLLIYRLLQVFLNEVKKC